MKIKSYIAGFLTAVLLMSSVYAFAATGFMKNINAMVGGVNLVIDGTQMTPKDANGKIINPLAFEGTTYVPIRFVSNIFNRKVTKIGDTIYIGDDQKVKSVYVVDQAPYVKKEFWSMFGNQGGWLSTININDKNFSTVTYDKAGFLKIADTTYYTTSAILSDGIRENGSSYLINKKFSKLSGYFGIDDISTDNGEKTGCIEIYSNGSLIKRIQKSRGQKAEFFEIDISNTDILNLVVKGAFTVNNVDGKQIITSQTVCDAFELKLYPKD